MAVIKESQIALKLLTKKMSFSFYKRIYKVLNTGKMIVIGKVINSRRNYCNIIIEENIEQKQLVNDSLQKIEIATLMKSQRLYKWCYDNLILYSRKFKGRRNKYSKKFTKKWKIKIWY